MSFGGSSGGASSGNYSQSGGWFGQNQPGYAGDPGLRSVYDTNFTKNDTAAMNTAAAGYQPNWDRFGALMGAMGQQQQQQNLQRGGSLPQPALSRGDAASLQVLLQLLARRGLLQRAAQAQGGGHGLFGI